MQGEERFEKKDLEGDLPYGVIHKTKYGEIVIAAFKVEEDRKNFLGLTPHLVAENEETEGLRELLSKEVIRVGSARKVGRAIGITYQTVYDFIGRRHAKGIHYSTLAKIRSYFTTDE